MIGTLKDLTINRDGTQNITVTVNSDFRDIFDELNGKQLDIEIKQYREKRSRNANAYFHVLVTKIAEKVKSSNEDVKKLLVCDYGTIAKDDDGCTIGFKLPANVPADAIYPYVKCFDTREENGKQFNCYLVYKQTHLMDSSEMARLIDGAITEARDLGIDTDTPEVIARYKKEWAKA